MQDIKSTVDELLLMDVTVDYEDLVLKILHGLDENYRELSNAIQARETPISFDELHEKLINLEPKSRCDLRSLHHSHSRHSQPRSLAPFFLHHEDLLAVAVDIGTQNPRRQYSSRQNSSSGPCPYMGKCQLCGDQGHSAKRYPVYQFSPQPNCHCHIHARLTLH